MGFDGVSDLVSYGDWDSVQFALTLASSRLGLTLSAMLLVGGT
jgi:hypothetical protein